MSDYPANTAYTQRHIHNPWLRKKTSLSQSQTLTVDAGVDTDADADAEYESEEQSVSGTSVSKGDREGEELDYSGVNMGEADDDLGSRHSLKSIKRRLWLVVLMRNKNIRITEPLQTED
ncbi:hypothetical protein BDW67DRAFT_180772 [Aspergillus spinulosporus]